ncbi:MAG: hypothetical protein HC933_22645 [Pleurocapsa sp. SU_196_0]|nr:hypothetical protein [Pleurocapsa sp. SU_196_0]
MRTYRNLIAKVVLTVIVAWIASIYLQPLYYSITLSLGFPSTEVDQPSYPRHGAQIRLRRSIPRAVQRAHRWRYATTGAPRERAQRKRVH